MPLMLVFGFASSLLSRRFQDKVQIVGAIAVMIFALVILNRGLMLVGSPVTFDSARTAVVGTSVAPTQTQYATGADGVIEVPLVIENTQFVPQTVTVPADTPFRLVVDRREAASCSAQIAIPDAGVLADLKDNAVTVVAVPPMKAGTHTLTCGMGMMSGSIVAGVATPAAGGVGTPWLFGLGLALLAVAAYGVYHHRRRVAAHPGAPHVPDDTVWGFKPIELVIGGIIIVAAVIIGLLSGGFFR
jgi:hypothetical protein